MAVADINAHCRRSTARRKRHIRIHKRYGRRRSAARGRRRLSRRVSSSSCKRSSSQRELAKRRQRRIWSGRRSAVKPESKRRSRPGTSWSAHRSNSGSRRSASRSSSRNVMRSSHWRSRKRILPRLRLRGSSRYPSRRLKMRTTSLPRRRRRHEFRLFRLLILGRPRRLRRSWRT